MWSQATALHGLGDAERMPQATGSDCDHVQASRVAYAMAPAV
jgi:hypothetical protein